MKKLTFVLLLSAATVFANAQSTAFKPFKFDIAFGYAIPGGSGAKGGILVAAEPKYALNDNITLGLRAEVGVMARAIQDKSSGQYVAGDVHACGSYTLTGDYYLNTNSFRPF